MYTIIAGGRDNHLTPEDHDKLDQLGITCVVSGKARGIDTDGEDWANSRGIKIKPFPADWTRYGDAAGSIRNGEMADYADALAVFNGGDGTEDMVRQANEKGLIIHDFRKRPAKC